MLYFQLRGSLEFEELNYDFLLITGNNLGYAYQRLNPDTEGKNHTCGFHKSLDGWKSSGIISIGS